MPHRNFLANLGVSVNTTWIIANRLIQIPDGNAQYSNKLRDAMTKNQIKGKKEFLVFTGEVKICTSYLVREVKCSMLKIFLQS